jgi:hypothetical protein
MKLKICTKCEKRPSRISPSIYWDKGIIWCMGCAREADILREDDYEPEPEGFLAFLAIVNGGSR